MDAPQVIDFVGISFRSVEHLSWFAGSMSMLLVTLGSITWTLTRRPPEDTRLFLFVFWTLLSLFHLGAGIAASLHAYDKVFVEHTSPNGRLFSVDCIWFNAAMFAIYVALIVAVWRRLRRSESGRADDGSLFGGESVLEKADRALD